VAKYKPKTKPGNESVAGFIAKIRDVERRADCRKLIQMMKLATGETPRMWASMIGFGAMHYKYESGHEGDCFQVGFASRKPDLVLYLISARSRPMLAKLGKHRASVSCIYVRRLKDVDESVLTKVIDAAVRDARAGTSRPCS
jgi:hypothetical protein